MGLKKVFTGFNLCACLGWVGALWIIFVCFYILILKCVIIEESYFGQVMTFYPGFNILYEKKFWGP